MTNPWETPEGKVVWKTEAQYWSWLRGASEGFGATTPYVRYGSNLNFVQ
jgi:hypothetical protein